MTEFLIELLVHIFILIRFLVPSQMNEHDKNDDIVSMLCNICNEQIEFHNRGDHQVSLIANFLFYFCLIDGLYPGTKLPKK
jgi:hypothetical protein